MDATLDDIPTVDDFAQFLAADPGRLAEYCREVAQSADALIDAEAKAITTLIEIADAVELSAKRPAKTPKRRTR